MVQYIEDSTQDVDWKFVNVPKEHEEGLIIFIALFTQCNVLYTSNILDDLKELTKLLHTALTREIIQHNYADAQINSTRTRLNGTVLRCVYGPIMM